MKSHTNSNVVIPAFARGKLLILPRYSRHMGTRFYLLCMYVLSHIQLFATQWNVAHQAPLSIII